MGLKPPPGAMWPCDDSDEGPATSGSAQILQPTLGQCSLRRLVCRLPQNRRLYVKGQIPRERSPVSWGEGGLPVKFDRSQRRLKSRATAADFSARTESAVLPSQHVSEL